MKIDYILTAFSPSMFGGRATAHIRRIVVAGMQGHRHAIVNVPKLFSRIDHDAGVGVG